MNKKQIEAFVSCIRDNAVGVEDLYSYLSVIRPGDFHFVDGSHFPALIPGITADGVFVNDSYYLTAYEREDGKTTKGRAKRFCLFRGCVLPDAKTRNAMAENMVKLNESLKALGFPLLQCGEYWAAEDASGYTESCNLVAKGSVPSEDIYAIGKHVRFKRFVRGCIKVTPVQTVPCFTNNTAVYEETLADGILRTFGVSRYEFSSYLDNKDKYPKPGYYLLKSGSISSATVYDQEAGIFADKGLYISLDMPKDQLTAEQTSVWLKAYGAQLPEYFWLRHIASAANEINKALDAIGMKDFALPDDVLHDCWTRENLKEALSNDENDGTVKKRLLPVGIWQHASVNCIVLEDIMKHFVSE